MERNALLQAVEKELPRSRFEHTLRVAETAVRLADRFGADKEKADLAGILHDYCKYWPDERMRDWILRHHLPADLLHYNKELWHAPVGAEAVRECLGVTDSEVLDAIRYHTTGRPNMTRLEQVVFLADYIEPGRRFPGVDKVRTAAESDLDRAVLMALDNTIRFLIDRGQKVYPLTLLARNDMLERVSGQNSS